MKKYAAILIILSFSCSPDKNYIRGTINQEKEVVIISKNDKLSDEEKNELLSDLEIMKDTSVSEENRKKQWLRPLNVKWEKNPGMLIKGLTREQLIHTMLRAGFKKLDRWDEPMLRRVWLAYNYDQFFWDMHEKTGFPISIIYSYFIIEATINGQESKLMREHMNPGGVKYVKGAGKTKALDDCYNSKGKPIPCDFSSYNSYEDMINGWARVFNQKRYARCKSFDNAPDICKCLYKSGYHTANNWKDRADISRGYWSVRSSFPRND